MAQNQTSPQLEDENNETADSIGENFNSLLEASSILGSHFRFTVEKRWDDSKNITVPSYFVLNLESVAENLTKIPFLERLQIRRPFLEREESEETVPITLGSTRTKTSITKCLANARISDDFKLLKLGENSAQNHAQINKDEATNTFRETENITCTLDDDVSPKPPLANEPQDNVSLDDWLDTVLDD